MLLNYLNYTISLAIYTYTYVDTAPPLYLGQFVHGLYNGLDAIDNTANAHSEHSIVDASEPGKHDVVFGAVVCLKVLRFQNWVWRKHPSGYISLLFRFKRYFQFSGVLKHPIVSKLYFARSSLENPFNLQCMV